MNTFTIILLFAGFAIVSCSVVTVGLFIWLAKRWKIPLVIFKLVGDKRRPVLDLSKRAKIIVQNGIRKLKIKGTPMLWELKNFKNEHYYLTTAGVPALVLFEFAKDCYTPLAPTLFKKDKEATRKAMSNAPCYTPVGFEMDNLELRELMLKAVDDFDPDFIVRNFARINNQYVGGWQAFMREHGWMLGWLLLFFLALIGMVFFFIKAPEMASACANAATSGAQNAMQALAARVTGAPAG